MTIIRTKEAPITGIIKHNIHVLNRLLFIGGVTAEFSPHVRECEFQNPVKFGLWILESGIQLKESGILLTIEIQNPSSTDKDLNPVPGIWNPRKRIRIQVMDSLIWGENFSRTGS